MTDHRFSLLPLICWLGYLLEPVISANTTVYCTPTTEKRVQCLGDSTNCCALQGYGYFTCCPDSEYHRRKSLTELYGEPQLTAAIVGGVVGGLVIVLVLVLVVVVGCADCNRKRQKKPPDLARRLSLRAVATSSKQLIHSNNISRQKIATKQFNRVRPSPDTSTQKHVRPTLQGVRYPTSKQIYPPVLIPADYQPPEMNSAEYQPPEIDRSDCQSPGIDCADYQSPEIDCADYQSPKIDCADYQSPEIDCADYQSPEMDPEELHRQTMFI